MEVFKLGRQIVEKNGKPIFLPDIGTFFNQDMSKAKDLVFKLKEAGCILIKGELLHDSSICLNTGVVEKYYSSKDDYIEENYKDLINRKTVSLSEYKKLFELVKSLDMDFSVSVYDFKGALKAKEWGACALKIATSNITHTPLIRYVSELGLPIIIDTGRSNWDEISRAVQVVQEAGNNKLILEHSPYAPPAPLERHNLRMISSLEAAYNVNVGLSDHHSTEEMLYAVIAMGNQVIEKGVCFDDNMTDQGVFHALPISKVKEVLTKCNNIYKSMGTGTRFIENKDKKTTDRMCLVAKNNLKKGDVLTLENITFSFPEIGIPAYDWGKVENQILAKDIDKNNIINWSDVKFSS